MSESATGLAALPQAGPVVVQLTTSPADQIDPKISGDRVVWQDSRNGNWDIYMYDFAAGMETAVADGPDEQIMPAIDGDIVVWHQTGTHSLQLRAERDGSGSGELCGDALRTAVSTEHPSRELHSGSGASSGRPTGRALPTSVAKASTQSISRAHRCGPPTTRSPSTGGRPTA